MEEICNVACAADENYAMPLTIMLKSLEENASREINIFILDGGISKDSKIKIEKSLENTVQFINIENYKFEFKHKLEIAQSTYYRLLLPDILESCQKVIYIDCDMLVLNDIYELWNVPLDTYALGAVADMSSRARLVSSELGLPSYKILGIPETNLYFNAGLLIFNLVKWRTKHISHSVFEYLKNYEELVLWHDQDGLNAILWNDWMQLDSRWNVMSDFFEVRSWNKSVFTKDVFWKIKRSPYAVHFSGISKPWERECTHPYTTFFRRYYAMTEWKENKIQIDRRGDGGEMKDPFYIFPYDAIKKGCRIIIYGAGIVGQDYYHQLSTTGYCSVVGWVDSDEGVVKRNSLLSENTMIEHSVFDYVILAMCSGLNAEAVKNYLKSLNIKADKIFWEPPRKVYKLDYIREDSFLNPILMWRIEDFVLHRGAAEEIYMDINKLMFDALRVRYMGHCEPREWFLNEQGTAAYLNNAKVACTSIKASVGKMAKVPDHIIADNILSREGIRDDSLDCFKFTFVRNPFARLVSCYQNKYHSEKEVYGDEERDLYFGFTHAHYLAGYFYKDMGFEKFVEKICSIPYEWEDRHFRTQYSLIYEGDKCLVDFVGRMEELPTSYEWLEKKYDLNPLERYNKSSNMNWMDSYTLRTAKMVYKRYQKDVEIFGYIDEYKLLIEYLKSKGSNILKGVCDGK